MRAVPKADQKAAQSVGPWAAPRVALMAASVYLMAGSRAAMKVDQRAAS
jgi:hypothetical protein